MTISANAARRIVLASAAACLACATAPRSGDEVDIAQESAIILWDEAAKTQHFIRRASFRTSAKDFGFLVPTPTQPELAEASDEAFVHLERLTAPKVVVRPVPRSQMAPAAAAAAAPVVVLAQAQVAGYAAVVLEAGNARALGDWLKQHGYAWTPQLADWVKPYLERRWKVTAFKVDRDPQRSGSAESKAVRMSFKTEAPFFPYREPATAAPNRPEPRVLRTFVMATSRMDGTLGESGAWPGRAVWSDRIGERDRAALLDHVKLPASVAPGALWLTEFTDGSSPRPAHEDVFFRVAPEQAVLHKAEEVYLVAERGLAEHLMRIVAFGIPLALLAALVYAACRLVATLIRKAKT